MKKKYINYLLVTLVLSLCILLYFRTTEGFQASPVNLTNYTGQLTGLRFKVGANAPGDPASVFQKLFGSDIKFSDIYIMFERCNGDQLIPYYAVDSTGPSGSTPDYNSPWNNIVSPELVQAFMSPTVLAAQSSNDPVAQQRAMASVAPMQNLNFTRNSKIAPLNLVNQSISSIFNNIYGNLQKEGLILQSIILDNTNEFPKKVCENIQVPALTPKIIVNANTTLTGLIVKTSFETIMNKYNLAQAVFAVTNNGGSAERARLPIIKVTDSSGNNVPVDVVNAVMSILNERIGDSREIKTYTISNLESISFQKIVSDSMFFKEASIYKLPYSSNFYTGSSYFPDSVIQAYYTQLFMAYNYKASMPNGSAQGSAPPFTILGYHLSNPEQDITLGTATLSSSGSGSNSSSDASLLQKLRDLLCV